MDYLTVKLHGLHKLRTICSAQVGTEIIYIWKKHLICLTCGRVAASATACTNLTLAYTDRWCGEMRKRRRWRGSINE